MLSFLPNFSVGFSGNPLDLIKLIKTNATLESVYSGGIKGIIAGGRPQYANSIESIKECVTIAHKNNIKYEVALNSPCGIHDISDKIWWNKVINYLKDLEYSGVDRIIASHPFIMDFVKNKTNMQVVVSTICEVSEARTAKYYEEIGGDIIIPSMNVNYRIDKLTEIKNILKTAKIRIMVNEHCLGDCPWRRFHHNHYAHSNSEYDYHIRCKKIFLTRPHYLLTNNCIRPEDLIQYRHITDNFKIVGRLVDIDALCMRIIKYNAQSFDGNYVDLLDSELSRSFSIQNKLLDDLFLHKLHCNFNCEECGYCERKYNECKNKEK